MAGETIEQVADRLVRNEVLLCLSSLVSDLSKIEDVGTQDFMLELWEGPGDYQEAAEGEGWVKDESDNMVRQPVEGSGEYESWQECCESEGIDFERREVFEHWAVSSWFADELRERGETVVDAQDWNVQIWARTTTGQAISMDWIVQDIAKEVMA